MKLKATSLALVFALGAAATGCCNQAVRNCRVTYGAEGGVPLAQNTNSQETPVKVATLENSR